MAPLLVLLLCFVAVISAEEVEIHSPRTTQYGDWHGWKRCPEGKFANSMQIKYEGDQRGGDDTALNAVALYCDDLYWSEYRKEHWIMSGEGSYGSWQAVKYCPPGQVIIGFALRSEPDQRGNDDVGADNFAAYCGTPNGERARGSYIQGDTEQWGSWTADQWCPQGLAVCGINSQVEGNQGGRDDTTLNNVDLLCCRAQSDRHDTCDKPSYKWVRVGEYDNRRGAGSVQATFTHKVAFVRTHGRTETVGTQEKHSVMNKVTAGLTFSVKGVYKGVEGTGGGSIGYEHSTTKETLSTYQLQTMVQEAMTNERTESVTYNVPAYKNVIVDQLFLTCGGVEVRLAKVLTRST
ncbi:unnamed protein product [Caenorhabditis sp. 36 PRJEB53466]|nr:unnamed protein product [Caenorhabditis sp. 36 PRJEB53466]